MEIARDFRRFVVEVNTNDSDRHIEEPVKWWLDHDEERLTRAHIGQLCVTRNFTWDTWVNALISSFNDWKFGQSGIVVNYPVSLSCAHRHPTASNEMCTIP
jgi:hypothetical protein